MGARLFDALQYFGLGYFVGLGLLNLCHFFVEWPSGFNEAAILALLPAVAAAGSRLRRKVPPGDGVAR